MDCEHTKGTIIHIRTYPATREEPSETVGSVECNHCGAIFLLGDAPEEMTIRYQDGRLYD